jgi:Flp pilus assembly protein TadD
MKIRVCCAALQLIFFHLLHISAAEKSSSDAPNSAEPALEAFQKGNYETARVLFEELLSKDPTNFLALVNLGIVEYRLRNFEKAQTLLRQAVRVNPDATLAWLTLGAVYFDQDKLDAALPALAQAVYLEPDNPRARNLLGATIGRKGWYLGAESELRAALRIDPTYAEAHFNLALLYLQRDPPAHELARRHYNQALELGATRDPAMEKNLGDK